MNAGWKLDAFDFDLPNACIAQTPLVKRDDARLFVYHCATDTIEHRRFFEIPEYFDATTTLVLNTSKVIPAKLVGKKQNTSGTVAVLLVKEREHSETHVTFSVFMRGAHCKKNTVIEFSDGITARVDECKDGTRVLVFSAGKEQVHALIHTHGLAPLPPYIKRHRELSDFGVPQSDLQPDAGNCRISGYLNPTYKPAFRNCRISEYLNPTYKTDRERYQTVYAHHDGSIAAPTAGLHFTHELLEKLKNNGVTIAPVTLHVGPGTFRMMTADDIRNHVMLPEYFEITDAGAATLTNALQPGNTLVTVGTTSTRATETYFSTGEQTGETNLFIYPGYRFHSTMLITNFHLPRSTPLALVAAFIADRLHAQGDTHSTPHAIAILKKLYQEAIKQGYRFYSYGDAMLVTN